VSARLAPRWTAKPIFTRCQRMAGVSWVAWIPRWSCASPRFSKSVHPADAAGSSWQYRKWVSIGSYGTTGGDCHFSSGAYLDGCGRTAI
jgi:hypothetical protein